MDKDSCQIDVYGNKLYQKDERNFSQKRNKKKLIIKVSLTIVCTFIISFFLFQNINLNDVVKVFHQLSLFVLIFPFILYLLSHFFRALRFYWILEKIIPFKKLLYIVFINNFWNSILPLRMGELSYIFLLKKENIEATKGTFTLGTVRLFDILAIFIFFVIALFFTTLNNYFLNVFLISFFSLLLLILIMIVFFRRFIFKFLIKINSSIKINFANKFLTSLIETLEHFIILKSRIMLFNLFISSMLVWLFALLTGYFIVSYFIDISFFVVVLGFCLVMLTYILPVQGLLGFGTTEGAWALVLIIFGFTKEQAIATGIVFHILSLFYTGLLGIWGYFFLKFLKSNYN